MATVCGASFEDLFLYDVVGLVGCPWSLTPCIDSCNSINTLIQYEYSDYSIYSVGDNNGNGNCNKRKRATASQIISVEK